MYFSTFFFIKYILIFQYYLAGAYNEIQREIDWSFFARQKYREVPKLNFINYYNYIGGKQRFDGYLGNIL